MNPNMTIYFYLLLSELILYPIKVSYCNGVSGTTIMSTSKNLTIASQEKQMTCWSSLSYHFNQLGNEQNCISFLISTYWLLIKCTL